MPHITVSMFPGRTEEQKKKIAQALKRTMTGELGFPEEVVSVSIEDLAKEKFVDTVIHRLHKENIVFESSKNIK